MKIISTNITNAELIKVANERFGDMVKAVVDVEKEIMAIGGDLHADEESLLLDNGSKQENLWGINIYVQKNQEDRVEFDSMINIRPRQNNRSRDVLDIDLRKKITTIVCKLIKN